MNEMNWRLVPEDLLNTVIVLRRRIVERFPDRGIAKVAGRLEEVARECVKRAERMSEPMWRLRVLSTVIAAAVLLLLMFLFSSFRISLVVGNAVELAQGIEALINDLIFLSVVIYFIVTLEVRVKRNTALEGLRILRALAHIIDMHQLTKDPDVLSASYTSTNSSPKRDLSSRQLRRYLDYCSEMLSLIAKLGALLVQESSDSTLLTAVDEIEDLTVGLSQKIWQKIIVLERADS